jgi:DNA ligase-1
MFLDKIFKLDAAGSIRFWQAEVGEEELAGCWRTHFGLLSGKSIISVWKRVEARSQINAKEQALFYAKAAMEKKLKTDFRFRIDDIAEKRNSYIRPMKAYKYYDWVGPCFVQPKLDGMRCLANKDGLWTSINRKIVSCPHIEGELKEFFHWNPDVILDGELYNHKLKDNFNLIMSLTKKTKLTVTDFMRSEELIEYWVFDMYHDIYKEMKFKERWHFLGNNLFDKQFNMIKPVTTHYIDNQEELDIYNIELLKDGYEGQMVRCNAAYQQKRTHYLLKRKEFQDEEFELIDIIEGAGNWEGYAKSALCRTYNGKIFNAGIAGNQDFCAELLREKDKYVEVTVKYQMLTPDGIPRFPIATKFHEERFSGLDDMTKPKKDLFA